MTLLTFFFLSVLFVSLEPLKPRSLMPFACTNNIIGTTFCPYDEMGRGWKKMTVKGR